MPLPATPFWYLRHGETDYNARGLSQGALDIPLNATGRAQAAAAAPLLAGRGLHQIIASPMLRASETATIVNRHLALPLTFNPALREVVFGGMEGQPLLPWFADWLSGAFTPAGAESFAAVTLRVAAALEHILALPGPVLIVAHGGIFRALRGLLGLGAEAGLTPNAQPLFCEPTPSCWRITPATLDAAAPHA